MKTAFARLYIFSFWLAILAFAGTGEVKSQYTEVSISDAAYSEVSFYLANDAGNLDSLVVDNPSLFSVNDTVLFYKTTGGIPLPPPFADEGKIVSLNSSGKYAILIISEILGDTIVLNNTLPGMDPYNTGGSAQLFRIPNYENAVINSSFDFPTWDPVTKTGGIFAVFVKRKLRLEDRFSADGKGFKGAVPFETYNGSCSSADPGYVDEQFFTLAAKDSAGLRGETFNVDYYPYWRGRARVGSAGGGGNARFSGGGGGSNEGQGGSGGNEASTCSPSVPLGGQGGFANPYSNVPADPRFNLIYFGGGGGTSTQDPGNARVASPGGNGGGIIIIIADTLEGNSQTISANGLSVNETNISAGAGGGGAGGVVIINTQHIEGNLTIQARGGDGGDVSGVPESTGPGGGGGGGVIWYNDQLLADFPGITSSISGGASGQVLATLNTNGAFPGSSGDRISELQIPIRGFLINNVPDGYVACEGTLPENIAATRPVGGNGNFTYSWLKSDDMISWTLADGVNNERNYQPPDTLRPITYYYRRAISDGFLVDTSFSIPYVIQPRIENNTIQPEDTVCFNESPISPLFATLDPEGGNGSNYTYTWEQSGDLSSWITAQGISDQPAYTVPSLLDTTYYRRKVESGSCISYSDTLTITVLPLLNNNIIAESQIICNNQVPEELTGPVPIGGQPGDKRYQWYQRQEPGSWSPVATTQNYSPPSLPFGIYDYRREVYSGSDDACINMSDSVRIIVHPDITGNSIDYPSDTICAALPEDFLILSGNPPSGGDGSNYLYRWQIADNQGGPWNDGPAGFQSGSYSPGTINETAWFRRIVYSGNDSACISTSNDLKLEVLDSITNNLISDDQTLCQFTLPETLTGQAPQGGITGDYDFGWEFRKDDTNWAPASGDPSDQNYIPPIADDTSYFFFRRNVYSGPDSTCRNTSNVVTLTVQPSLRFNTFEDPLDFKECVGSQVFIDGVPVDGGDGIERSYIWQDSTSFYSWQDAGEPDNQEDYTRSQLNEPAWFRRIAISGECRDTSEIIMADTLSRPVLLNLTTTADTICHDQDDFYLILEIFSEEGSPAPYTVEFLNGVDAEAEGASLQTNLDSVNVTFENRFLTGFTFTIAGITDNNGCAAVTGLERSVPLWVNRAPDPGIVKTDDPLLVCGPSFSLTADPDTEVPLGFWTLNNPDIRIDDPENTLINLDHVNPAFDRDSVYVYYNQETRSCPGRKDSILVRMFEQPETPQILEGDTLILFIVDNTLLTGSEPSAGSFEWEVSSANASLSSSLQNPVRVNEVPIDEEVVVSYRISNGICQSMVDQILIDRREVRVYEGISPDRTPGQNDFLIAEGLDVEGATFNFQIFSTQGMLVREITSEDIGRLGFETGLEFNGLELWDGKANNEQDFVPPGTYYYVLIVDYKDREFIDKGFIVVK